MAPVVYKSWLAAALIGVLLAGMRIEIGLVAPSGDCCEPNACCCQAMTESGCCEVKQPQVTVSSSCDCGGGGEHLLLATNGFVFVPTGEATAEVDEPCDAECRTGGQLPCSRTTVPETPPPRV